MLTEVNGCAASGRRASDRLSAWMQTPTRCTSTSRTAMQWTALPNNVRHGSKDVGLLGVDSRALKSQPLALWAPQTLWHLHHLYVAN
eukprot:167651-Prorocentrum_minimum.AAC.3